MGPSLSAKTVKINTLENFTLYSINVLQVSYSLNVDGRSIISDYTII